VLITVLHLLHGWSDRDETTGHYDDDQRVDIALPSTGRHQHHSTSSANNTYRHLPVIYYDHIYASTTTSTTIYIHRLLHSTPRTLLLDYTDHSLSRFIWNTPSRITHYGLPYIYIAMD